MSLIELELGPLGFLQLAGHPVRWAVLRHLARSDHTVRELTALAGEPQNLVSYHLGKLRGAGLVSSRRSSADGRDAYYRADLPRLAAMLTDVGVALHPGLEAEPPSPSPAPSPRPTRILFLCTGNSARSQIAEALAQERSGGAVDACSAGSRPKPLHPNAVRVLREEYGIDIGSRRSKDLDAVADQRFDQVVTLCDRVREVCPELPGRPESVHWSMPDPSEDQPDGGDDATYPAFRRTAAEIDARLGFLLASLRHPTRSTTSSSTTLEEP